MVSGGVFRLDSTIHTSGKRGDDAAGDDEGAGAACRFQYAAVHCLVVPADEGEDEADR